LWEAAIGGARFETRKGLPFRPRGGHPNTPKPNWGPRQKKKKHTWKKDSLSEKKRRGLLGEPTLGQLPSPGTWGLISAFFRTGAVQKKTVSSGSQNAGAFCPLYTSALIFGRKKPKKSVSGQKTTKGSCGGLAGRTQNQGRLGRNGFCR